MTFEKSRSNRYWMRRIIFFPIIVAAGIFIFGSIVMWLWNAVLPELLGVKVITFWQALGILVLSKILFGGFWGRCHWGYPRHRRHALWEKWHNLSPEEKEEMKKELRSRFNSMDKSQ